MSEKNSNNQNQQSKQPTAEEIALKEAEERKSTYEQKLKDLDDREAALKLKEEALSEKESSLLFGKSETTVEEAIELNSDGKMIGNLDEDGKYPFDPSWNKGVVVRQVDVRQVDSDVVELPSSDRLAVYEPEVFDHLQKNKGFSGKKVTIIHDYRKTVQL